MTETEKEEYRKQHVLRLFIDGSYRQVQLTELLRAVQGMDPKGVEAAVDKWNMRMDWDKQKPRAPHPGELVSYVPPKYRPKQAAGCLDLSQVFHWSADGSWSGNIEAIPNEDRARILADYVKWNRHPDAKQQAFIDVLRGAV